MLYFTSLIDDDTLIKIITDYLLKKGETYTYITKNQNNFPIGFNRCDLIIFDNNQESLVKLLRKHNTYSRIIILKNRIQEVNKTLIYHPFGYLDKPIKSAEVYHLMDDLILYKNNDRYHRNIRLNTSQGLKTIKSDDILYFENITTAKGKKTIIYTYEKNFELKKNVKIRKLHEDLKNLNFEIPHISFLVNLCNIQFIKGYDMIMENGDTLPLSQRRSTFFRRKFENFCQNH